LSDVIEDLAGMGYRTTWGIFSAAECGAPHQRKRVFILAIASGLGGETGLSGQKSRHEGQSGESDDGGGQAAWPSRPGEQQYGWEPPRVVGNSESRQDNGREPGDLGEEASQGGCGDHAADSAGKDMADSHRIDRSAQAEGREHDRQAGSAGEAVMANTGISGSDRRSDGSSGRIRQPGEVSVNAAGCGGQGNGMRQTQPAVGRNFNELTSGMDYAELCISGDNRTDEFRLLGNGVVPATAERAFRVLMKELT
jgi:DNA (cytosine-5)-methyltransferase 1